MHNSSLLISNQKAGTGWESREFIHEVVEEDFLERIPTQLCQSINLSYKIFVFKFCSCIELDSIIESFRDREQVNELHETTQRVHEVTNYGSPSHFWRIIERNFVNEWDVSFDWIEVRYHCGIYDQSEQGVDCNFNHQDSRINYIFKPHELSQSYFHQLLSKQAKQFRRQLQKIVSFCICFSEGQYGRCSYMDYNIIKSEQMEIKLKQTNIKQSRRNYFAKNLRQRKIKVESKAIQYLNSFSDQLIFTSENHSTCNQHEQPALLVKTEATPLQNFGVALQYTNPESFLANRSKINEMKDTYSMRNNFFLKQSDQTQLLKSSSSVTKKRDHYLSVVSRLPSLRRTNTQIN